MNIEAEVIEMYKGSNECKCPVCGFVCIASKKHPIRCNHLAEIRFPIPPQELVRQISHRFTFINET